MEISSEKRKILALVGIWALFLLLAITIYVVNRSKTLENRSKADEVFISIPTPEVRTSTSVPTSVSMTDSILGDYDGDEVVDLVDYNNFLTDFTLNYGLVGEGDYDGDGEVGLTDYNSFLTDFMTNYE